MLVQEIILGTSYLDKYPAEIARLPVYELYHTVLLNRYDALPIWEGSKKGDAVAGENDNLIHSTAENKILM